MIATGLRERIDSLLLFPYIPPEQARAFAATLIGPDPAQLSRINPLAFSEEHGLDPGETADFFLCAARTGICGLTWNLVCPACGAVFRSADSINQLRREVFPCSSCQKDVPVVLDDSVEILFSMNPGLLSEDAAVAVKLGYPPQPDTVRSGDMRGERVPGRAVRGQFLSGKMLLNNQVFRALFPQLDLAPDLRIPVRSLTALSARLETPVPLPGGQNGPCEDLRQHLPLFRESTGRHSGAIVRVSGDGFLATFSEPRDGILAALDMTDRFLGRQKTDARELGLRVGLNEGPARAENRDGRLDYAGQAVDGAARVCDCARQGEVWLAENAFYAPDAREIIEFLGYGPEEVAVRLEGAEKPVRLYGCRAGRPWKRYSSFDRITGWTEQS